MHKVHVKSFGCSANIAEGEMIKGQFAQESTVTEKEDEADTIVLNICTVKGDKNALDEIRKVKEQFPHKKIAIAGCITPSIAETIKKSDAGITLVNTHHVQNIVPLVRQKTDALTHAKPVKLLSPRVRANPVVGIVPISSGCLDACAFCSTRLVKGTLFSFPPETIEQEAKNCIADGCKEIWITGQDTCCYGFDRKTNLAELLERLVAIPGDFKIRVGMGNPRHVPKYLDALVAVMKHEKIFKFLHIPMQAGNDEVLKNMRRGHTAEQFRQLVNRFRQEIPNITISTDIIVGYPGETEEQFLDTMKLVEELQIDNINISRFAPRPGTPAATMDRQVHGNISKERSTRLAQLYKEQSLQLHQKWLGWEGNILIDETAKDGMSGRNDSYKTVIVRENLPLGSIVRVKIVEAQAWCLIGKLTTRDA
ncbi:MAG: tRNA (N(6)-L-threonylcarbamoyladenosine(37)-C(2))-methylthiotransferase [Candidatus Auribacter fodinae]|uniref:tRNA (N(6)-L-threonylcarbamoyladenosine(37)-C(2))-methylthiotransferase n=1 Tax=Candidatus Auribacter fodinae TaxID=2093366 RepID=A0A3A4QXB7_9BACT|nr:MAG: tRNA (N(6)-L-threonylcarbamoyladenosine(37)-C(2))-methylthiotransferase [Candidatus Auribacter fodinae]